MTTNLRSGSRIFILGLLLFSWMVLPLRAAQSGLFTYRIIYSEWDGYYAAITDCSAAAAGVVTVPSVLGGRPVKLIYSKAFHGCIGMTSVIIPASITNIRMEAFMGCTSLQSILVDPGNPFYTSEGGALFDKARTALVRCPEGFVGAWILPTSVTSILSRACHGCSGLTSISLPSTLTTIESDVFAGCTGLTHFTFPAALTTFGNRCFQGCNQLASISVEAGNPKFATLDGVLCNSAKSIVQLCPEGRAGACSLPVGVTDIASNAFSGCRNLTSVTLPWGLATIGSEAFSGCSSLTSIYIPSTLNSINAYAFLGCSGIQSILLDPGNSTYSSSGGVLFNKSQTALVMYPAGRQGSYTVPSTVTSILPPSFNGAQGLTIVSLHANVSFIGASVFSGCPALQSIHVAPANQHYSSNDGVLLTKIGHGLVQFPGGRQGAYVIPDSVRIISRDNFGQCRGLTSVTFPAGLEWLWEGAFRGCDNLESIAVDPANPYFSSVDGVLFDKTRTLLRLFPRARAGSYVVPAGVTSLSPESFEGCTLLSSVTLPASLTDTGYGSAFEGCSRLTQAVFLGNAPALEEDPDDGLFDQAPPDFTLYRFVGKSGYSSKLWEIYPTILIDEAVWPAAPWLLSHGLWYDTGLDQDPNGDGVDLLLAYALNLNPKLNLQDSLPVPLYGPGTISLNFHATTPGINYKVETSTDLKTWTTEGVVQTAPGPDQQSTGTIQRNKSHQFLRLVVGN